MIERYQCKDICKIWEDDNKLKTWLDVELSVVKAWSEIGIVPKADVVKIVNNVKLDKKRMLELEELTKHDVVAFTRMLSEHLGDEKKWIHLGLTSTDIVDTAQNILIKQSNQVVEEAITILMENLKVKALENKKVITSGRTHGIYGEPTSLGLKFLLWYEEMKRHMERFDLAKKHTEVTKISGSMGNYANVDPRVEDFVGKSFGLEVDKISTQVNQRDRHAFLISVFANIASTLEKVATEIRLFQRSEVQEMNEGFSKSQKGSSSMPHKKNPISSENICGLSRFIRSFTGIAFENNILWHERDISHSSNERIILPDIYNALVYVLRRTNQVIEDIYINKEMIQKHIENQNDIFFSQRILTYILINKNFSREEVYDFIQKCSIETLEKNKNFKTILTNNGVEKYLSLEELDKLFDLNYFLENVESIYRRIL